MLRKWALYLGNILGEKVFIHWIFMILLVWIFLMHTQIGHGFSEAIWGVVFSLALLPMGYFMNLDTHFRQYPFLKQIEV